MSKIGRNDPCHCGSGKKYKKCCMAKDEQEIANSVPNSRTPKEFGGLKDRKTPEEQAFEDDFYNDEEFEEEVDSNEFDENNIYGETEDEDIDYDQYVDDDESKNYHEDNDEDIDYNEVFTSVDKVTNNQESDETPDRIEDEYPEINEGDEKLVDDWWDDYKKLEDPVIEKAHLENFIASNPELVIHLGLHHEVLFELGADYLKIGKYDEFIEFLMIFREEFPDSYLKSAGYYERDIIVWLISKDRTDEIHTYTNLLQKYYLDCEDKILEIGAILAAKNLNELFLDHFTNTYLQIFKNSTALFPYSGFYNVSMNIFDKYVNPGKEGFSVEDFLNELIELGIEPDAEDDNLAPKIWQKYYDSAIRPFSLWDDNVPNKRGQLYEKYLSISTNFTRYLKEEKGLQWASAHYYGYQMNDFLTCFLDNNKKPKQLFNFSINIIDKALGVLCQDFMYIDFVQFTSILTAIYYFADYLQACGNISEEEKNVIKDDVFEYYAKQYSKMKTTYTEALIFSKFPNF